MEINRFMNLEEEEKHFQQIKLGKLVHHVPKKKKWDTITLHRGIGAKWVIKDCQI